MGEAQLSGVTGSVLSWTSGQEVAQCGGYAGLKGSSAGYQLAMPPLRLSPVSESGSSSPFEGEPPPMPNSPLWHPLPFPAGISISPEEPRASSPLPKSNYLHWISAGTNIFLVLKKKRIQKSSSLWFPLKKSPVRLTHSPARFLEKEEGAG